MPAIRRVRPAPVRSDLPAQIVATLRARGREASIEERGRVAQQRGPVKTVLRRPAIHPAIPAIRQTVGIED